jgi:hypothetical protein
MCALTVTLVPMELTEERALEAVPYVARAGERLGRQYDAGLAVYDDLAAPSWEAFQRSRRRFLNAVRPPRDRRRARP